MSGQRTDDAGRQIGATPSDANVFFCHGTPGSPADARIMASMGVREIIAPNLLGSAHASPLDHALAEFDLRADTSCHVLGFSLGAMAALHIAARRPDKVSRLTLVSPAAPLSMGQFLPQMKGAPVFRAAQRGTLTIGTLSLLQSLLYRAAPRLLVRMLFAGAATADQALLGQSDITTALHDGLRNSLIEHRAGYARMLCTYVSDWSDIPPMVNCHTRIWHGTCDTWAPAGMAEALAAAISGPVTMHRMIGDGHYSTLAKAAFLPVQARP